jgi:peptidyl-prolyl cis-trans isomerase A (cyclophilin A)
MSGLGKTLRALFQSRATASRGFRRKRRPELEALEDRSVPTVANVAPVLSGTAFVDGARTGTFRAGDAVLPGVTVTLTGTTYLGTSISATTTTDSAGNFQFMLVPNGTYQLSFPKSGFLAGTAGIGNVGAPNGVTVVSGITVSGGQSIGGGRLAFEGIDPNVITLRMFLASSGPSSLPGTLPGAGSAAATGPTVKARGIPAVTLTSNGSHNVDLAAFFSAPDITTSQVTFNISAGGKTFTLQVQLFDSQTPQYVANFLDYVRSGGYNNSILHRLTSLATDGLAVLQGGGATLQTSPTTTLTAIPITNPGVTNEFSNSNIAGTIAMALSSMTPNSPPDPNSATNQFFFNLVNNAASLDRQQFTVFGKVVGASDQQVLGTLAKTPVHNEGSTPFARGNPVAGVGFGQIPMNNYTDGDQQFPTDTSAANYIVVNSVNITRQNEALTYVVTNNTNQNVATATLVNNTSELLKVQAVGSGTTTITVTATDQFGNSKAASFTVTVP